MDDRKEDVEEQTNRDLDRQDFARLDELINLTEIDPDALREAEFMQAQMILDTLVGETIASAMIEDTRIVVETKSGNRYFFYGFMGGGSPREAEEPEPARQE